MAKTERGRSRRQDSSREVGVDMSRALVGGSHAHLKSSHLAAAGVAPSSPARRGSGIRDVGVADAHGGRTSSRHMKAKDSGL